MRILVRTKDVSHDIRIWLPTALLSSRLAVRTLARSLPGKGQAALMAMDSAALSKFSAKLRRFCRTHPNFTLLEVHDSDGTDVIITL